MEAGLLGGLQQRAAQRLGEGLVVDPVPAALLTRLGVERADRAVGQAVGEEVQVVEDDEAAERQPRVTDRIASAPSCLSAAMFAWWVTELDSSWWPGRWREMCRTSAPAKRPLVTGAEPKRVSTSSGSPSVSMPGSAYVPDPVRMPIRIGARS